jgi:hypothetical protein
MAHPKTLLVHPNPYAAPLDEKGRPTGAYPFDPQHDPGRGHVGARRGLDDEGALVFEYESEPVPLPFILTSNHYRRGVACGDIIAADLETAIRCGITEKEFRAPSAVVAEYRAARLDEWKAQHPGETAAIEQAPAKPKPESPAASDGGKKGAS